MHDIDLMLQLQLEGKHEQVRAGIVTGKQIGRAHV